MEISFPRICSLAAFSCSVLPTGRLDAAAAAAVKSAAGAQEERVHVAAAAAGRWEVEVGGGVGKGPQHAGLLLSQRGEALQPPLAPYISCLRCYF